MVEWTGHAGPVHAVPAKSDCEPWEPWAPEKIVQRWTAARVRQRFSEIMCRRGIRVKCWSKFFYRGERTLLVSRLKSFFFLAKRIHHG